ncbi:MAG: acetate--CoA ligase family protein [Anaerolineales bacterium]
MKNTLAPFFDPKGIVLVGASQNPKKLGFGLAQNLIRSGYQGEIYFVNPKGGTLFGRKIYTNISQVPDPVDLAVLLIPAPFVADSLTTCGKRGIPAAVIASGGFRESGKQGADLEAGCLKVAREYSIRILGPNCIGLLDTHLPLDATFLPPPGPTAGDVAFISHSGAICAAVIDWARGQGFGLSRLVSLGNQADVSETDVLEPVAKDPHTRVITLYLEGISDGRRFVETSQRVTQEKPIVALKVGRFESSQQAVSSHTGALAGTESAYHAAFRRAGVIRADTSEELFDWARALAWCPPSPGRNVAVLTNAGGPGVTAADAIEGSGLNLASLSAATQAKLQALLPPAASIKNPVDMLAGASPEQYADCLSLLLEDTHVDSGLVILPPPPMHSAGSVARALIPIISTASKPVVIALMGERMIQEAVEYFRAARVPEYRFPERAASALAILAQRAEYLAEAKSPPVSVSNIQPDLVRTILENQKAGFLPSEVANQILAAYGIPILKMELAASPKEAADLAEDLGFPVALKIASDDIVHKSDVGGVLLNVATPQDVIEGFNTIIQNSKRAQADAHGLGIHVQQMAPSGQEVIVGAVQDTQFGAVVMFGSGGVEVEALKDVAFSLAPLTEQEAETLLKQTWAGRKLNGYRQFPAANRAAVLDVLYRIGQLASDFHQLAEIEINPLRVTAQGAIALDARMKLTSTQAGPAAPIKGKDKRR